ncbi:hypothetical protein BDQ17DRAFT_1248120 [Cyathus striatus]|nr:hypothetical protein BDQ17DRAFT_1248120 [Cyathus striatus]
MITCHICLEDLKSPVSLPCGHIFCKECIRRAVEAIKSYSSLHSCPSCRALYTVAPIDPAVVPAHLRPHLTPSIRKVYLDQLLREGPRPSTSVTSGSADVEIARLRAENAALRTNCDMWRRRAEVHGAATLGLLELTRMARDQAIHVSRERDELQKRCHSLKRRLDEDEYVC